MLVGYKLKEHRRGTGEVALQIPQANVVVGLHLSVFKLFCGRLQERSDFPVVETLGGKFVLTRSTSAWLAGVNCKLQNA